MAMGMSVQPCAQCLEETSQGVAFEKVSQVRDEDLLPGLYDHAETTSDNMPSEATIAVARIKDSIVFAFDTGADYNTVDASVFDSWTVGQTRPCPFTVKGWAGSMKPNKIAKMRLDFGEAVDNTSGLFCLTDKQVGRKWEIVTHHVVGQPITK